ncbi:MAG: ribose-phosphate pyrophosphokinase [Roseivirga sp.]|nr:ribose-phosphate pyrophosphokinase [Roseivirga sp.]
MKHLNLDPHFTPFGNGIDFEKFTFSGGEPHIRIVDRLTSADELMITQRINSFNDMGLVLLAVDALRRIGVRYISLFIPYFPGARQDRLMTFGEPLTVKVYADLINALNFEKVIILDPHSEVTPALINNVQVITNHHFVGQVLTGRKDFHLVAPDAGAVKKIYGLAKFLETGSVVTCGKRRDVRTGSLTGFEVYAEDLKGKTCIVVDDICDGGGTFLGLAKELKSKNAGRLIMIVTHGIFGNGSAALAVLYDEIICTDSFQTHSDSNIRQIELNLNHLN